MKSFPTLRRRLAPLVAGFWLAGCSGGPGPDESGQAAAENVVFILVDTLRADRIEAKRNGRAVMPKLRVYAGDSRYFTRAVSQGSWTKPAMVSIFTSLYPEAHNVNFLVTNKNYSAPVTTDVIPEHLETMAQYLKAQGYSTAAVQTNAVMMDIGADRGFDTYFFEEYPAFTADKVTDKTIESARRMSAPFFLYVHYTDPHAPYQPPEPYRELFGPLPEISEADRAVLNKWNNYYMDRVLFEIGLNKKRHFGDLSASARERLRMLYDGEARFIDDQVSRLLKYIEKEHPNTLVILTADHGEELWEHGSVGHGKTVFEELIHVPLIIHGRGLAAMESDVPVETIDILPTVAARLGLERRDCWQGRNLFAHAKPGADVQRPIYSQNRSSHKSTGMDQKSVRFDNYKLVQYRHSGETLLFDLARDRFERNNLARGLPGRVADLEDLLKTHLEEAVANPECTASESEQEIDREMRELVQNLGYVR